ncbi:MAG: aminotransferase class IV [Spirochaetales bacterium]|nr:aminotransferase class IV [Spirochaetales bacterium]
MERSVYLNGKMIGESEARISIFDVGRLYGATFYESIRTFGHKLFHVEQHLERLRRSLSYAGILEQLEWSRVEEAVAQTLAANEKLIDAEDDMWLCVEVTPGTTFPMPLQKQVDTTPTVFAYSAALPHGEYARCYTEGKAVVTSLYRHIPPQCFEQRCKHRSRLPHFLSKLDAKRVDPDAFAVMLDIDGFITEGTGANIFFVVDGMLMTPKTRNILVGISRQYAIELAAGLGIPVQERDITLYDAYNAEEAFWTTSSYCILPICRMDGRKVGQQYPGKVAGALLREWSRKVGVDIVAQAQRFAAESSRD